MYTDNPAEIEVSDIDAVQRMGDAFTLPDGRVALPVLLMLATHTGKPFGGEGAPAFPTAIHLSNGVQNRMVAIADRTPNPVTVEEEAAAAAPESTPEVGEGTAPEASESAPAPEASAGDAAPVAEEPAAAPAVDEPAAADEAAPTEAVVDAPAASEPTEAEAPAASDLAASEPEA